MSLTNPEDAASLLEQFVHDGKHPKIYPHRRVCDGADFLAVANTPAEITHLLEEIQHKDMQIHAFRDEINKRDLQLQKWVRVNGGHVLNPKEEAFSRTINDCYDKIEILQAEKCGLSEKGLIVLERQMKRLDLGLRSLSTREEFPSDWAGPSLVGSGPGTGVSTPAAGGGGAIAHGPLQVVSGNIGTTAGAPNIANAAQMRMAQAAAGRGGSGAQTPKDMPRGQREGSSEANKRRRLNASLGALPTASSSLRQSSLGPGTPKAGTPQPNTSRAGSAQPKPAAGNKKGAQATSAASNRKPVPGQGRKRDRDRAGANKKKSANRRSHLTASRATPSTTTSLSDEEDSASPTPSSLQRSQADGAGDKRPSRRAEPAAEVEWDEDEDEDDPTLYCFCQKKSFGNMIGCDNDNCEFQWFHYACVGISQQPSGEWLCPECRKLPRSKVVKSTEAAG